VVDDFSALFQLFDRPVEVLPETPDRQAEDQPSASVPAASALPVEDAVPADGAGSN
jgi:hypothetical protein